MSGHIVDSFLQSRLFLAANQYYSDYAYNFLKEKVTPFKMKPPDSRSFMSRVAFWERKKTRKTIQISSNEDRYEANLNELLQTTKPYICVSPFMGNMGNAKCGKCKWTCRGPGFDASIGLFPMPNKIK